MVAATKHETIFVLVVRLDLLKGHLRCKTILRHKAALDV